MVDSGVSENDDSNGQSSGPILPDSSYLGIPTVFRRPFAGHDGADLAFLGLPFDMAVSNKPGARLGPRAVRIASLDLWWGETWPWGFDPFERLSAIDCGDVTNGLYGGVDEALAASEERIREITRGSSRVLSMGGDHLTTLPALRALANRHGRLGLVHFDAHTDTSPSERLTHGSVFHHALREDLIDPARGLQVGVRTAYPSDTGLAVWSAPEILDHGPGLAAAFRERVEQMVSGPVYVSVDIDCLDPAFAPGTGTPIPGGLATWQLLSMLRKLDGIDIVGGDVVEIAPDLDPTGATGLAGAAVLLELSCAIASRNGPRRSMA